MGITIFGTLSGWSGAAFGHSAESNWLRAALVFAVVTCALAVFFSRTYVLYDSPRPPRLTTYRWRELPIFIAMTPMLTVFLFGLTPLGILSALGLAVIAPMPSATDFALQADFDEKERDELSKYRPKILDE